MRIRVGVSDDITEWFDDLTPYDRVAKTLNPIRNRLFLISTPSLDVSLKSAFAPGSEMGEQLKNVLSSFISDAPRAIGPRGPKPDIYVGLHEIEGSIQGATLGDVGSNDLDALFEERTKGTERKESRESFLKRTLGPLLPYARGIDLLDSYAGSHILGEKTWLIESLVGSSVSELNLYTQFRGGGFDWEPGDSAQWTQEFVFDKLKDFHRSLDELCREPAFKRINVNVSLYPAGKGPTHDRRLRLRFDRNGLNFELPGGTGPYEKDFMEETTQLSAVTSGDKEFGRKMSEWGESLGAPARFAWVKGVESPSSFGLKGGVFRNRKVRPLVR